jgi:hypothetical protein
MIVIDKKHVLSHSELYHATGLMGESADFEIKANIINAIKVELHDMDIEDIIRIYVVPMIAERVYSREEYTTE